MAGKLQSEYLNQIVDEMTRDGEMAINEAYYNRDFTNRTYNLHDSYGSAVYVDRKLIKRSIRYIGQEMSKSGLSMGWVWNKSRSMPDYKGERRIPGDEVFMRGREEVMDFFSHYIPTYKGIQLVIVAAMYYANYLEAGAGHMKHKYKVITGAKGIMEELAVKYNGHISMIDTYRDKSRMTTIKDKSWVNG